jgi:hypothetical protein
VFLEALRGGEKSLGEHTRVAYTVRPMKRSLGCLVQLGCLCLFIGIAAACFRNVFSANLALLEMARETACGARRGCSAQMIQLMRTPIEHTYVFVTPARPVEVRCVREFYLFGDYACTGRESGLTGFPVAPVFAPPGSGKPQR